MSTVDKQSANWRLYGGGGLLVGGLLWLVSLILNPTMAVDQSSLAFWLGVIGLIIMAIGFFILAWGQTGSNGVVGGNLIGKLGLYAAALGTLLWAILPFFMTLTSPWTWLIAVLIVVGTLLAAIIIMQKGVARGLGKWAMFLVVLLALLFFLGLAAGIGELSGPAIAIIFAIVVALTGLIYLFNKK